MYHRTVCKNPGLKLTEENRKESMDILKEMLKPNASKKYLHYSKYQESLEECLLQIHEANHIQYYISDDVIVPPFIEDDKTLLVKSRTKTKTILELFSGVKKISNNIYENT